MARYKPKQLCYKRGKPIAFDHRDWPIFGYNQKGEPVCFSKKVDGSRCMSVIRFANGRCKVHGGTRATNNIMASGTFRQKLYKGQLPPELGKILVDAVEDPDAHSLKEELGVNTVQIVRLLSALGKKQDDADGTTWQEIKKMAEEMEELLFDEGVQSIFALGGEKHKISRLSNLAEKMVQRVRRGADEHKLFKEINEATEYRRRLIETDMKRLQMSRNMIPAAEAMQMFKNIITVVKQIFYKDTAGLRMLAQKLDESSLNIAMKYQDNALGAKISPGGFVDPSSEVGDDLRKLADEHNVEMEDISTTATYDGEATLDAPMEYDENTSTTKDNKKPKKDATMIRRKSNQMMESGGQERGFVQNDRPIPRLSFQRIVPEPEEEEDDAAN